MSTITIYEDTFSQTPIHIPLREALRYIAAGRWKDKVEALRAIYKVNVADYKEAKKSLPAIQFCGKFGGRKEEQLEEYSSLLVIDIDGMEMAMLMSVKTRLSDPARYAWVYAVFISPSGSGLKVLVKTNGKPGDHRNYFRMMEGIFFSHFLVKIDASGKDKSRLCYVSHDPTLYLNADAVAMPLPELLCEEVKKVNGAIIDNSSLNFLHVLRICIIWTEKHFKYVEGQRNSYIHNLACNCNRCGVPEDTTTTLINEYFPLGAEEVKQTVNSAYRHNKTQFSTTEVFSFSKKEMPEVMAVAPNIDDNAEKQELLSMCVDVISCLGIEKSKELIKYYYTGKKVSGLMNFSETDFADIFQKAANDAKAKE